jgi:putative redox protein
MAYLTVSRRSQHSFEIKVEGHRLIVDARTADGGHDAGPTPTELLVASLAACAASNAEAYLAAHSYAAEGLGIACHYQLSADQPKRVSSIDLTVTVPPAVPAEWHRDLLRAIEQCTVGTTLRIPPRINVILAEISRTPA